MDKRQRAGLLTAFVFILMAAAIFAPLAGATVTTTIQPTNADTMINNLAPTTNYGSSTELTTLTSSTCGGGTFEYSFFKWNLAGSPSANVSYVSAQAYKVSDYLGATRNVAAWRIASTWVEGTVTWNTAPSYGSAANSTISVTPSLGWYSWNITNLYKAWKSGAYSNYGIALIAADYSNCAASNWASKEYATTSLRPKLVVQTTTTNYTIWLNGNQTVVLAPIGGGSLSLGVNVHNTGDNALASVKLDILNQTNVIVATAFATNVTAGSIILQPITVGAAYLPAVAGDYAWKTRANYTSGAMTIIRWYNFTLRALASSSIITAFSVGSTIVDPQITSSGFTYLKVTIISTGTQSSYFTITFSKDLTITLSPSSLTTGLVGGGATLISSFVLFPSENGLFTITTTATPVDAYGAIVGAAKTTAATLLVEDVPAITTLSPTNVGSTSATLQGSVSSLGGLASVRVYFVYWPTVTGLAGAVQVPLYGIVVTFPSAFSTPADVLQANKSYTYEFRAFANGVEFHGGLVAFMTPSANATAPSLDPFTAIKVGFASGLHMDPFLMGIILGAGVVIIFLILALVLTDSGLAINMLLMLGVLIATAVQWFPWWFLAILVVWFGILIFRLPQFHGGAMEDS